MAEFTTDELDRFAEAVQSLKLYRRAELESSRGEDLIEKLYVDPLPNDFVHKQIKSTSTTFLIGRKGTGKSTVFLRAQKSLLSEKDVVSTYVDIKTVFESAQVDPASRANLVNIEEALPEESLTRLLLMTSFLKAVIEGVRDDLKKKLSSSWKFRVKEAFTGTYDDLSRDLDNFIANLDTPAFANVQGIRNIAASDRQGGNSSQGLNASMKVGLDKGPEVELSASRAESITQEKEHQYSEVLLRTISLPSLISGLKKLLEPLNVRHLFVFLDDFSELPADAMKDVVDALIAPLNNWSDELVKFKIAAYPGRIYYGSLDKTKIDEVSLDLHSIYGQATVADMEDKAVDFTKRLVERRLEHFGLEPSKFIDSRTQDQVWVALFRASLGNPRALGYVLYFVYEAQILYGRRINVSAIRDAAKKYYEDKLEPYFAMGAFLHESFEERSTVFSLKELLESLVNRAREVRTKDTSSIFKTIEGQHPTSHFNVSPTFDSLLSTLELNFFITKYYVMSNRDGQRVSVYALNYGLCEKYSIAFGRPTGTREQRLYFVERVFDYNPLLQDFIASNQEIRCDNCGELFDAGDLDALKRFGMLCPECKVGTCIVTNISKKYSDVIQKVSKDQMLPSTELGILQTLNSETNPLYAGDIAGELDVSHQLIGKRAKRLGEQDLVERKIVRGRPEFTLSTRAERIYFNQRATWPLQLTPDGADN